MSRGMTPQELVQQVFYLQEKVLLDFWPTDDKYKEVLMEANFVIQELQKEEDWSWLRAQASLGFFEPPRKIVEVQGQDPQVVPDLSKLPTYDLSTIPDFYKLSGRFGDCVRLYAHGPIPTDAQPADLINYIIPDAFIPVEISSVGQKNKIPKIEVGRWDHPNVPDLRLYAHVEGNKLVFNHGMPPWTYGMIVVVDYQKLIPPLHICNPGCVHTCTASCTHTGHATGETMTPSYYFGDEAPCDSIESIVFTEIPDPSYIPIRTAYYHAQGSPTAQGMIPTLQDQAQKMLSSMRQNDALATMPDYMEYETPGFFEVV